MSQLISLAGEFGLHKVGLLILALSIFVDIIPSVKFNPWKWAFAKFGKYINTSISTEISGLRTEMNEKIDELKEEQKAEFQDIRAEQAQQAETLNKLIMDLDYKELSRIYWEVSEFEANLSQGSKYPRGQYLHIMDEAEKYLRMAKNAEDQKNIVIDAEYVYRIRESLEKIQTYYDDAKNKNGAGFLI